MLASHLSSAQQRHMVRGSRVCQHRTFPSLQNHLVGSTGWDDKMPKKGGGIGWKICTWCHILSSCLLQKCLLFEQSWTAVSNIICSLDFLLQSCLREVSCILFLSHIITIIFSWLWNKIRVARHFPQNQNPLQLSTTCWFTVHVRTNNLAIKMLSVTECFPPACAAEGGMRSASGPATPVWGPVAQNLPSVWTGSERTHAGLNKTLLIRKIVLFSHALGMFGCCWKIIIYPVLQSISFIRIQHTSKWGAWINKKSLTRSESPFPSQTQNVFPFGSR